MTHLLDTSALLAHYLAEPGAERVQALFADDAVVAGASILSLYEFELRLHQLGVDGATRAAELSRYRVLLNEVLDVDEAVRSEAIRLRTSATAHVAANGRFDRGNRFAEERDACSSGSTFRRDSSEFVEAGSFASEVRS